MTDTSGAGVRERAAALSKQHAVSLVASSGREPLLPQGARGALAEPCASCGEKCCNRFAVPITGFDAQRILERLGGEGSEFAELAPAGEIESAIHASVFLFDAHGKLSERLLSLRRKRNNYCIFSRHSQGCAIWGFHPMVCRSYPFALKAPESPGVKIAPGLGYTKNFVCPRPWEQREYDEGKVRSVLETMHFEIEEYNKIVRNWNANFSRKVKETGDGTHAYAAGEKAFWKFLIKESKKKMKEWEGKNKINPLRLPSLGAKRGYIEPSDR